MKTSKTRAHPPRARLTRTHLGEISIMVEVGRGNEKAFAELHRRYEERLIRFAMILVGRYEDAQDIVQETFIRVWNHAGKFDSKCKVSTWIYLIAQRLCFNFLRTKSRRKVSCFSDMTRAEAMHLGRRGYRNWEEDKAIIEFLDPKQSPHRDMLREEFEQKLADALAGIAENQRNAFDLRMFCGKTYNEIAEILGLNPGTVKSTLFRARESLRPHLDRGHFS